MLFKAISNNKEAMQFEQKNNSLYLFQSTIHTRDKILVMQLQKKSGKRLSRVKTARQSFGDNVIKELQIPQFVDKYNYNINHVDKKDQLRASYKKFDNYKIGKNYKALFF